MNIKVKNISKTYETVKALKNVSFQLNSGEIIALKTIKQAYQIGLIDNGHIWIDALSDRNLTVHTYDEKLAEKMVKDIVQIYYPEIEKLYDKLIKEL